MSSADRGYGGSEVEFWFDFKGPSRWHGEIRWVGGVDELGASGKTRILNHDEDS